MKLSLMSALLLVATVLHVAVLQAQDPTPGGGLATNFPPAIIGAPQFSRTTHKDPDDPANTTLWDDDVSLEVFHQPNDWYGSVWALDMVEYNAAGEELLNTITSGWDVGPTGQYTEIEVGSIIHGYANKPMLIRFSIYNTSNGAYSWVQQVLPAPSSP